MAERSLIARRFLVDAQRLEARAQGVAPDDAARFLVQARALRDAAARIAERDAVQRGELSLFG